MQETIQAILETANNAYEGGECQIHLSEKEIGHGRGDKLADFLHIELQEVCLGNPSTEMIMLAANAVATAIKQLELVEAAIINLSVDPI